MATQNGEGGRAQDPTKLSKPTAAGPAAEPVTDRKGKGKAVATEQDLKAAALDDEDDEEEEEDAPEVEDEDDDEDDMGEIDLDNVIGSRTRGRIIDFAKAAEENPAPEDEEDDDEDDDFEDAEDKMDEE